MHFWCIFRNFLFACFFQHMYCLRIFLIFIYGFLTFGAIFAFCLAVICAFSWFLCLFFPDFAHFCAFFLQVHVFFPAFLYSPLLEDTTGRYLLHHWREQGENKKFRNIQAILHPKSQSGLWYICRMYHKLFFHLRRLKCCHCKYIYYLCRSLQLLVNFHRLFGPGCPILFWFSKFW